jgi:hypothetical protein
MISACAASGLVACGSTPTLRLTAPAELTAARELADDGKPGDVWLHWRWQARVDASNRPGGATSELRLVAALTRFQPDSADVAMTVCAPLAASNPKLEAQLVPMTGAPRLPVVRARRVTDGCLDPQQTAWRIEIPAPQKGDITELNLVFDVPGTLRTDFQALTPPTGRLVEGLWRYDLPGHGSGALAAAGSDATVLATEQGGRRVYAAFVRDVSARPPREAFLRYATHAVEPVGQLQDIASSWPVATANFAQLLANPTTDLSAGYVVPYKPDGADDAARVAAAFAWVQARLMAAGGADSAWNAVQALPDALAKNTLTSTDKAHLLAWVLREARLPFRFAMARPAAFAPLDAAFPQADAFTTPLIAYTPADSAPVLLDPACETCEIGAVRPALRGGQAVLLPYSSPTDWMELQ